MSNPIYVIDHFALAFRSFYAFINNPLINSKGEPTSVLFGYCNALFRLIAEKGTRNVVIAKDISGPNFRHELYPEYKANRSEMPEEMRQQLPDLDQFIKMTGVPVLSQQGFEADDIMASLAEQLKEQTIYLFTKDKDMMQMVNDRVFLFHLEKSGVEDTVIDRAAVEAKFGVGPEHIRDLLALMGDSADNVPGVPKVGPKTAADLLKQYGSLEGIYENLNQITKKALHKNLSENRDKALLSQRLVSLAKDLEVPLDESFYTVSPFDENLEDFLKERELNGTLRHFKKAQEVLKNPEDILSTPLPTAIQQVEFHCVKTLAELDAIAQEARTAQKMALDTETSGLDTLTCDIAGICLSANPAKGYYLPLNHKDSDNLPQQEVIHWLNTLIREPQITWYLHNAKFDFQVLSRYGIDFPAQVFDTMIASYLLNPGVREHSLDAQVKKRLGHLMIPIEDLIGKGKKQISFTELTAEEAYTYSAEDAAYTLALAEILEKEIIEKQMQKPLNDIEIPLMKVLTEMEQRGISLDGERLKTFSIELAQRLADLTQKIYAEGGKEFNISSPKQLGEMLFEDLGLKTGKKTKTGYSTDASVLHSLRNEHPIIPAILEYRELEKLKNTYVDVLPDQIHPKTQRVHTSFSQTIAATGRLSSINPNLQNIPIRTPEGRKVREAFISSDPDKILLAADYSQIELRVLAHLSQDENLLNAYRNGLDIHTQTAALLLRLNPEEVSPEQRRQSKAVNFGILYGMSAFRLSNELEIPRYLAQEFIDGYFAAYPKVTSFIQNTIAAARQNGYVETLFGHRRYLPDIDAENMNIRSAAERIAVNTPIQGTAAGLIKLAMIELEPKIQQSGLHLQMLLQVHDELVFEVAKKDLDAAKVLIKSTMENAFSMDVPLTVEVGEGLNWLDAH